MAATLSDFYRGDSKSFTVEIDDSYDGYECWFTLKNNKDDADADAVMQKTETLTDNGLGKAACLFSISPAESTILTAKNYNYDIQIVSADKSVVRTILNGTIRVNKDITRDY